MNIKLTINGKEIDAQISEADAQKIQPNESRFFRKADGKKYSYIDGGSINSFAEEHDGLDNFNFAIGNYFTSEKQAQDYIRALKLWQAIKVFRQEHEGDEWKKLKWNESVDKYSIYYNYCENQLLTASTYRLKSAETYFAKQETAQAVIDEFYGELMWYFTEFEDD